MTPILADAASHRARFAWLAAGLAATVALAVALQPVSARTEPTNLRSKGCAKWRTKTFVLDAVAPQSHVPASCLLYQTRMLRLSECPQLPPESRRALREAWAQTSKAWRGLSGEAWRALADGCRMATDALEETAAAVSCDITGVNRHWPSYIANDVADTFNP